MNLPTLLILLTVLAAGLLHGCVTQQSAHISDRPLAPILTEQEAIVRALQVADVAYDLSIDLTASDTRYNGEVVITFNYQPSTAPLTIDFTHGEIHTVRVNGTHVKPDYNDYFLTFAPHALPAGINELRIRFSHDYSDGGSGFYRFVDPEDQRVYTYTDFEPYHANRLFPLFDQPDLKAKFALNVVAPREWTVVSTMRESYIKPEGDNATWEFPSTSSISSYVFSLHAGEYHMWEDSDFRYPMRLFARHSLAQYVDAEEWFKWTRDGFDFFDAYFELPYPFKKYDQLLVPEYPMGAMENIGAVTFNEAYLSRSTPTWEERRELAMTLFHEMAHMWFGNTTTMRWWNGLWLNESFASYMAYVALEQASEFDDAWEHFYVRDKKWAYSADDSVTTHAIELPTEDTDVAIANFDGITYGKGASVLKQANHFLGDDVFQRGVAKYLGDNAFANTELEDFVKALGKAGNTDLEDWSQRWLYEAGLNRLEASYRCQNGHLRDLSIKQSAPDGLPTLRQQKLQIASFQNIDGALVLVDKFPTIIDGATTQVEIGSESPCPDVLYPNYGDWAYAQTVLDKRSLTTLRHHISSLDNDLLRTMLWHDLWIMVRHADLPVTEYLQILAAHLTSESRNNVLRELLRSLNASLDYLHLAGGGGHHLERFAVRFERMLWEGVARSAGDERKLWLESYIQIATTVTARDRLVALLKGDADMPELSQDDRWHILYRLATFDVADIEELLLTETKRDSSNLGQRRALSVRVAKPDADSKMAYFEQLLDADNDLTLAQRRTITYNLFPPRQRYLGGAAGEYVLNNLEDISSTQHAMFHRFIAGFLPQKMCTTESVAGLSSAVDQHATPNSDLNPDLIKAIRVAHQADQRCVAIDQLLPMH